MKMSSHCCAQICSLLCKNKLPHPNYPSDTFKTMFSQPSPWINNIDNIYNHKIENINKQFIDEN